MIVGGVIFVLAVTGVIGYSCYKAKGKVCSCKEETPTRRASVQSSTSDDVPFHVDVCGNNDEGHDRDSDGGGGGGSSF